MSFLSLIIIPKTDTAQWVRHFYHSRGTGFPPLSTPLPLWSTLSPHCACVPSSLAAERCLSSNLGYRSLLGQRSQSGPMEAWEGSWWFGISSSFLPSLRTQLHVDKNLSSLSLHDLHSPVCSCSHPTFLWPQQPPGPWLCGPQVANGLCSGPAEGSSSPQQNSHQRLWFYVPQIKYNTFLGNSFPYSPTRTPLPLITMPLVMSLDFLTYSVYQMLISHRHALFFESLQ